MAKSLTRYYHEEKKRVIEKCKQCGAIEKAEKTSMALIEKLGVYDPDTVIFWCPTCLCRIHTTISHAIHVPFEMISFPQ